MFQLGRSYVSPLVVVVGQWGPSPWGWALLPPMRLDGPCWRASGWVIMNGGCFSPGLEVSNWHNLRWETGTLIDWVGRTDLKLGFSLFEQRGVSGVVWFFNIMYRLFLDMIYTGSFITQWVVFVLQCLCIYGCWLHHTAESWVIWINDFINTWCTVCLLVVKIWRECGKNFEFPSCRQKNWKREEKLFLWKHITGKRIEKNNIIYHRALICNIFQKSQVIIWLCITDNRLETELQSWIRRRWRCHRQEDTHC